METVPPSADSWAPASASLRAADPRMASLVDADPTLDPGTVLDGWPTALWDALVFNVVGQQLSVAATGPSWHGSGRYTTGVCRRRRSFSRRTPKRCGASVCPARRPGTSATSRSANRMVGSISSGCGISTTTQPAQNSCRSRASGVSPLTVFDAPLRRPEIWPAADLALPRAVERVWELDAPASLADIDAIGDRSRPWRTLAAL